MGKYRKSKKSERGSSFTFVLLLTTVTHCFLHPMRTAMFECVFLRTIYFSNAFLAHLSQRLKWAIVIGHRPSSVRPSSVVVRPSVNFHILNFFSRTAWWILMKLGRDLVLMVPYKCCCFSDRSAKGRIQGGAKIGHGGSPSSRIFFFRPEGYSNKPNG